MAMRSLIQIARFLIVIKSITVAQQAISLVPDCTSSQSTPVCAAGGNVVQALSANPVTSPVGIMGWAFMATAAAPTVDWRFYSNPSLTTSPIATPFCSAGTGVTFAELGTSNAVDSGSIWFVVYLAQASNVLQPILRITSPLGCTYDYSAPAAISGGPVYFYTNIDDNSLPEIVLRIQLAAPVRSAICTAIPVDGALTVSSLSIRNAAVTTALPLPSNFVLRRAGFVSGPSASQLNCAASYDFVIPTPAITGMGKGKGIPAGVPVVVQIPLGPGYPGFVPGPKGGFGPGFGSGFGQGMGPGFGQGFGKGFGKGPKDFGGGKGKGKAMSLQVDEVQEEE